MPDKKKPLKSTKESKAKEAKKTKLTKTTVYFAYMDQGKVDAIDLKTKNLQIKQISKFAEVEKDEIEIKFSIKEVPSKIRKSEKRNLELLNINCKLKKQSGDYILEVVELKQDDKKFPKAKNKRGVELWMLGKIDVLGIGGSPVTGGSNLEFVLPPLEYDEILELQLDCTIGKSKTVCGVARIAWDTVDNGLNELNVTRNIGELLSGGYQHGENLETIVIHCMCAFDPQSEFDTAGGWNFSKVFDPVYNEKILKKLGLSAHFIISRDGEIIQNVEMNKIAWHAYGANSRSIGIELLGIFDDFRQTFEKYYKKLNKAHNNGIKARDKIQEKLNNHLKSKAKGIKKVKIKKRELDVEEAISQCNNAIQKLNEEIKKQKQMIEDYENHLAKVTPPLTIPDAYLYTDAQYESLGKLLELIGKRYGYKKVRSHHNISPDRKTDPGKYFDWDRITDYLLPGSLKGNEETKGGLYTVN